MQVAQVVGDPHVAHHRPADVAPPCARAPTAASSTCWTRCTWEAKQATMIRWLLAEDPVEHRGDVDLGRGEAGDLGVGGVGQEQVDALLAEPRERPQVGDPAVQRQLVHLEVAGVQAPARRRCGWRPRARPGWSGSPPRTRARTDPASAGPPPTPCGGRSRSAGARAAWSRAARGSARSRPAGCRRARGAGTASRRCGPRDRGSAPAPRRRRAGPGSARSRAGSGRRRGGGPRGTAPRSRRSAAGRRTRRPSCCGRPRRDRRAG